MADLGGLVKAVTEWPARCFFALACVAAALLFISLSPWAELAGVLGAPAWFRLSLTVATLSCFAIGITKGGSHLAARRAAARTARNRAVALENQLRDLTPDECALLARFVDGNVRVASFVVGTAGPTNAVAAQALALRGHLYQVARRETAFFTEIDYAIQESTFMFLRQYPNFCRVAEGHNFRAIE